MIPSDRCWHCGDALAASVPHVARVEGIDRGVCCIGCRAAAEWIDQLGLAAYYTLRTQPAMRTRVIDTDVGATPSPWTKPEIVAHVVRDLDASRSEAIMLVEGIRCSACVWLIERIFASVTGVERIQVNASAQRVRVVWDRTLCSLAGVLDVFARAGYAALPLEAGALDDARRRENRDALKRLVVAGFGTMQAMMYAVSLYLGVWDEAHDSTRIVLRWLGLLVATPVVFYSARPFFTGALRSLKAGIAGMDVPVAIAIAMIYAASMVETLRGNGEVYFDSVSMFVFVLLIGRYLEMRARHHASDLSDALARLSPQFADRIRPDGSHELVAATSLRAGDSVHVGEGSIVPADGRLAGGRCRVDEAMLSGESAGVVKRVGDRLIAGSLLVEGSARMTVETVGANTMLAGIVTLAGRALTERPRLALAGERAAARFVVRIIALAAITAVGWLIVDPARAFTATLSVLVVSCPCAFALAVPAAMTRALATLARAGVLIVRPDALEKLAAATHVVFDKTGTLTQPGLSLTRVDCLRGEDREEVLAIAAALARGNRHPLSQEIVRAAAATPIR
ncbi:MAG: heavy metal translocating P-type ATPase, partial [Rhodanobacteraceae bacterium]